MSVQTLNVQLAGSAYDIIIGKGLLAQAATWLVPALPSRRAIVIADSAVAGSYGTPLLASLEAAGRRSVR